MGIVQGLMMSYPREQQGWQPGANTVAYYPLASQNTLNDESGNGYNLTNSGTILYDTYNGVDCVKFDQTWSMNVSNVNKLPSGNSAFTVSYWIYPNSLSGTGGESNAFFIGTNSSQRGWLVHALSPISISVWGTAFQSTTNATLSTWQNIIVTQNGNLFNLYLNGNFIKSGTMTLNMSTKTIKLGGSPNNNAYWYKGGMSNFIIEDKERTAQEISDYYNLTKGNYGLCGWKRPTGVLGGYWKLNGDMTDSSGCGHNGTGTANYVTGHKAGTQAYNASSTSYYVSVANSSDLYPTSGEKFSVAFWIKPAYASGTAGTYGPISMTRDIDNYTGWSFHNDSISRNWQFRTRASGGSTQSTKLSSLTWTANTWFHFVLTYDGTTVKYYKDGTLLNSFTRTFGNCSTTYPLTIGYASTWVASANAALQEVMVMKNYCLSQNEITNIYNLT